MTTKCYYDFEFLEGTQTKRFMGIPYGQTKPTIDIISVGMVSSDNREYYAVSKDFNLWEAWNRWQPRTGQGDRNNTEPKEYWIRENVLKPIFDEWKRGINGRIVRTGIPVSLNEMDFTYKNFKHCIDCVGKTKEQIAEEVVSFVYPNLYLMEKDRFKYERKINDITGNEPPELYGYYSSFDHCALSWLFGKMIDLPKGFPMYTRDLKQMLDEKLERTTLCFEGEDIKGCDKNENLEGKLRLIKMHVNYPTEPATHHALLDAKWNMELHRFIQGL